MPWLLLLSTLLFSLNSCSPKITPQQLPVEPPAQFSYSGTEALPEKWWTSFNDSTLNRLIDTALSENLDLLATWEQFQAARALVRVESSNLWPQADVFLGSEIVRSESGPAEDAELYAGLTASYEFDLWGRIRAGVQAEDFRAQASFLDYQTTALVLSAEISTLWYRLVSARRQLQLAEQQIKTNEDILRLIRARFTGGQIRAVDILRQEQLVESTRNEKIFYETEAMLLQHQLATLLGLPPQNISGLQGEQLPPLPPLPETGLPLELIRRRPDIQRAYNLLLATDRELAEAVRNRYPRLSVDLNAQLGSGSYNNLFQTWAYSLAGNLVTPLLYGGRLKAEVDLAEANKNQQLYRYGQEVLIAFREVEDALIREKKQEERLEVLQSQLELARKTNSQLQQEFLNGLSEYVDVLLSLDQEQQLQRDLIEARQVQLENRIALYSALAGGFSQ